MMNILVGEETQLDIFHLVRLFQNPKETERNSGGIRKITLKLDQFLFHDNPQIIN